jgi:hypothetical protein
MQKAIYFIGHNNDTKELESDKACAIISRYFEGFTAFEVVGYWHGARERTLKVEVVTDEPSPVLVRVAKELRKELDQEAIMLEVVESNVAFVTE